MTAARQRPTLLRAEQIAEICGVSQRVAADLMRQMPRINIGRSAVRPRWAVEESEVYAFLAARTTPPEDATPKQRRKKPRNIISMNALDEYGHIPRRK